MIQKKRIEKHIGACRFVYNLFLEKKITHYTEHGKTLSCFALNKMLPALKNEFPFLQEVHSQPLQMTSRNLDNAFTRFFREKKGFPKFKSKKNPLQSYQYPQGVKLTWDDKKVYLPKVGDVKCKLHQLFDGTIKTCTISRTSTGKYFISILVDDKKLTPKSQPFTTDTTIGIDVGIKHFATLSDGTKIDNSKFFVKSSMKLKKLQQSVSRKVIGSKNYQKSKLKVAKCHEIIANQRSDFLHKLSFKLVSENQAIAIEDLNVSGMIKNRKLAKHIVDASWSEFRRQLEYKCKNFGKTLLVIGRFEPSSKICNHCGYHNNNLELKDRVWVCPECGYELDRDVNAAINIKKFALLKQNTGKELPEEPVEIESDVVASCNNASVYESGSPILKTRSEFRVG
jgi:putative transposase